MSLDWTGFKDNVGTRAAAASALILASLCLNVWFWWKDLFEFKPINVWHQEFSSFTTSPHMVVFAISSEPSPFRP